jgi:acyl phosphate:glycerol-3-phosphate acyltransferase
VSPFILLVASYLLGAIPSSYLAGRLVGGVDLREHGSGNLGASNTFRVLGARVAAPVMAFDILKGWFPAWFFPIWDGSPDWEWGLGYGAAAILGHVFPLYMRFRGGKGVATAAGVFLALAPSAVLAALAVWLVLLGIFRIVSIASIGGALALAAVLIATETRMAVLAVGVIVSAFVIVAHRANLVRLARGEEFRFARDAETRQSESEEEVPR